MIVKNSLSVREELIMEERPIGEAQMGEEEPMEEVPTAKLLTEQGPIQELTEPLRWEHASSESSEPFRSPNSLYHYSYNNYM